jgi:hypothetical protein
VTRDGDHGAAMSFAGREPLIEPFDMRTAISLDSQRAGGGLDESPLEILVDVAAGSPVPDASAAGVNAGHESCVAGQILGAGKSLDVADLQPDQRRENLADAGNGPQQTDLGRGLQRSGNAVFDLLDLRFELVERGGRVAQV